MQCRRPSMRTFRSRSPEAVQTCAGDCNFRACAGSPGRGRFRAMVLPHRCLPGAAPWPSAAGMHRHWKPREHSVPDIDCSYRKWPRAAHCGNAAKSAAFWGTPTVTATSQRDRTCAMARSCRPSVPQQLGRFMGYTDRDRNPLGEAAPDPTRTKGALSPTRDAGPYASPKTPLFQRDDLWEYPKKPLSSRSQIGEEHGGP